MADRSADLLLEVRCCATGSLDVLAMEEAALISGIAPGELVEALAEFGACETDGYMITVHPVLHAGT
ncbi:hypothetical protein [Methylopila sp. Yamaguchi]|uniref:hypothetical protein n=1 Tax=Methylopila sp. Yamaguchi TaxID=1437817 RepID=UPI000CCC23EC|nr:hypothetical protein [Methylopila sp. Yamaguchi]